MMPLKTALEITMKKLDLPFPHKVHIDDSQQQFTMNDETRVVATLPNKFRCPCCSCRMVLWRFVQSFPTRVKFQVRCSSSNPASCDTGYCTQEPWPKDPIADARQAVQAWCVLCAMTNLE